MPNADGYEVIRRVRVAGARNASLAATALTAYARDLDRNRDFEAGFDKHVAKSVEPAELLRVAAELVRRPRQ